MKDFTMLPVDSMTLEIHYHGRRLCLVDRGHGLHDLCIEFLAGAEDTRMALPLNDFEAVLKKARRTLEATQLAMDEQQQLDA